MPARMKHGLSGTPTYATWVNMINRCHNPKYHKYPWYGGRGIYVCDAWRENARNFVEDMGYRPEGRTIGRIDNDGPYCRENCRWESVRQQSRNKRNSALIEFGGRVQVLADWAAELGISRATLVERIERWGVERALSTPPKSNIGEQNSFSKLTEDAVREMRRMHLGGASAREIAEHFPVCMENVSRILRGKIWKHVK